jgi:hypothetical protein
VRSKGPTFSANKTWLENLDCSDLNQIEMAKDNHWQAFVMVVMNMYVSYWEIS